MTPFLLLGHGPPHHLTIQWVREITSLDSKLPVHIRSDILAEKTRSHSSRTLFARTAAPLSMLVKNINNTGRFLFTAMQNSRLIWPIEECFWVKEEDYTPGQTDPKGVQVLPILLAQERDTYQDTYLFLAPGGPGPVW